jgi:hypothetical protein
LLLLLFETLVSIAVLYGIKASGRTDFWHVKTTPFLFYYGSSNVRADIG